MLILVLLIVAAAIAFLLMAGLWAVQWRTGIAATVDVGWSLGVVLVGSACYALGDGNPSRKTLAVGMAAVWGLRLSGYVLFTRVLGVKEEADGRYAQLRKEWKTHLQLKFFAFFQFQGGLVVIFGLPAILMSTNAAPGPSALEWSGAAVWLLGVVGEVAADLQLYRFKRNPAHKGQVCATGLWNLSRHPNYFFEWLVWVGFCIAALPSPGGWVTLVCPALMLFFLFQVTGIPENEAQALRSRGDAYREYQRTTSVFVPWFKKA